MRSKGSPSAWTAGLCGERKQQPVRCVLSTQDIAQHTGAGPRKSPVTWDLGIQAKS